MRFQEGINPATECGVIEAGCAHISTTLIINNQKQAVVIDGTLQYIFEVSDFSSRFVVRVIVGRCPNLNLGDAVVSRKRGFGFGFFPC